MDEGKWCEETITGKVTAKMGDERGCGCGCGERAERKRECEL